ncbi:MAG: Lrp/AsnC family transcriptional regulator [Oscillospiraceae bacterium]|nr:Lrp/AsnC family transcriptional regulator [Oscillospiraceae bacterium]
MNELLDIMGKNSFRLNDSEIARMLGITEEEVTKQLEKLENDHIIVGYKTLIDWEKTDIETVTALIELRVTPKRGEGYDELAKRIYKYPQVKSVYLMSGAYDLALTVEGKSMKEVALFVAQKLAPMESVVTTATYFVLRKYKEDGVLFDDDEKDTRQVITL